MQQPAYRQFDILILDVMLPGMDGFTLLRKHEFGTKDQDARHFDKYVLKALEEHQDDLETLFNAGSSESESGTE